MSPRTKRIILAIAIVQIFLIVIFVALPQVVLAIPGRFRVALSERNPFLSDIAEGVIEQVAPVATALPAPEAASERPQITIPAFSSTAVEEAAEDRADGPVAEPGVAESDSVAADSASGELPPTGADDDDSETSSPATIGQPPAEAGQVAADEATLKPVPTATQPPVPTPTPIPIARQVHLQGMPRIQQSFNNCGPANLTQVLNWYGNETTQAEAAAYLKPNPEDRNVSPWQLSDYVNEFTELRSTVHSGGDLEMIKRFLSAGLPVVVEKGYEPETSSASGWFGHYLTVFGYDEDEEVFYSMDSYLRVDPTTGRADPYAVIDDYWKEFNYTFYVVYEPEQEAVVQSILGQDMLEPMRMWENAALRAQEQIEENPEDAFAWFNLGTSLTRMGELTGEAEFYENGAAAFDEARTIGLPPRMLWYEFRPYLAYMKVGRYDDMIALADTVLATQGGRNVEETYLYMGHAKLFQGDVAAATNAYRRALELNENFYPAEIALESLG